MRGDFYVDAAQMYSAIEWNKCFIGRAFAHSFSRLHVFFIHSLENHYHHNVWIRVVKYKTRLSDVVLDYIDAASSVQHSKVTAKL